MNATDPNDMVDTPRRLHVLGSTGSIGVSTLEVIESLERSTSRGPRFEVVSLAAGVRAGELEDQAARFGVTRVAIGDEAGRSGIDASRTVWCGPQAATEMIAEIALAMKKGVKVTALATILHACTPHLSEPRTFRDATA